MKSRIKRDIIKRNNFKKFEGKRRLMKAFSKSLKNSKASKIYFKILIRGLKGKRSSVQLHNSCQLTYKSHTVFRFFGLERTILRESFINGSLNYICYKLPI